MQVVSLCPLRTGSLMWQVARGVWAITVVCKATFALRPGESALAAEQEVVNEDDEYWNDDPARSLHAPSDLVPFKPRADVLLVGHAFAPHGEPVRSLLARLVVGEVDKAFEVHCDRLWTHDKRLVEGARFVKMPLRWERAAGGPETSNPIGVRVHDATADVYGKVPIPNLQPAGVHVGSPGDSIEPIGFGPIAPTFPPRTRRLGRHASLWVRARRPMEPVPPDLDAAFFNSAPDDQQTELIRDDERIALTNLHPEHPRLVTNLPGIHPVAFLQRGEGVEELGMIADTLWIDTDRGICTVTWRARVDEPPQNGRVLVAMEGPGERISWSDVERLARRAGDITDSSTVDLPELVSTGATPVKPRTTGPAPGPVSRVAGDGRRTSGAVATGPQPEAPPISARAPQRASTVPKEREEGLETVASLPLPPSKSVLPFAASGPGSSAVFRSPPKPPSSDLGATMVHDMARLDGARGADASPAWLAQGGAASEPEAPESRGAVARDRGADRSGPWLAPMFGAANPPPSAPPPPGPAPPSVPPPAAGHAMDSPWAGGGRGSPATLLGIAAPPLPSVAEAAPNAAVAGAVAASNAAALSARASQPSFHLDAPPPAAQPVAAARPAFATSDAVELLWFDPKVASRLPAFWKELVLELDFDPLEPRHEDDGDDADAARARHEVFGVLSEAPIPDGHGVTRAVLESVNARGRFTPPLVVTGGELAFPFDELRQLEATVAAISPLVGADNKKLKDGVDAVTELLKSGCLMSSSSVVERLTQQLRDLFKESGKASHAGYLELHVERMLLEQRHYQRRTLFGDTVIRALLSIPGAESAMPAYLPDALSKRLPVMTRLRTRVIAEVTMQQDQYEAHPYALRVLALGRAVPLDGSRRRR